MSTGATTDQRAGEIGPSAPSLAAYLSLHGRWHPDRPAVVTAEARVSWPDFDSAANRIANGLAARGLGPGDMVGVVMANSRAMAEALFGILKAGCCSVPLNLAVSDDALARMLVDSGAKALIVTPDQAERLENLAGELPRELLSDALCARPAREGGRELEAWAETHSSAPPALAIPPEAPCNVIYSSGTTGLPKGILHTHKGRLDWAYDIALAYNYFAGARTLCTIGLYSNIMWVSMLATLLGGGTLYIHERFDPAATVDTIARERITHIAMVPTQWQRLVDAGGASRDKLASLASAITVGAPMHAGLKERLHALMPQAFMELYGLTEGILTVLAPADMPEKLTTMGKPVPGSDLRILDENDADCPVGTAGEVVARTRFVMPRYLGRPEATAEVHWIDEGGRSWLRSGDIGYLDADGYLTVVDRKKDMILSGGQNIFPADIENALKEHEAVADCAVIGIGHPEWGETPLAIVVARGEAAIAADALKDWINSRMGKRQRVQDLVFAAHLPRNANGKILKRELRRQYDPEAR